MRFGVLGPLAVWSAAGEPVRIPETKIRALLAVLLVQEGRPVRPERLIDEVWGEHPPGNPANTLHTKVAQLRRLLEAAEPGARALLVRQSAGYVLAPEPEALDLTRFRALVAEAGRAVEPRRRADLLGQALALWRGAALADLGEAEFARAAAARWEEERLVALEERGRVRLVLGEHAALAGELAELAAAHPLREGLQSVHLRALHRAGRQEEAFAGYERLRRDLAGKLGVDPGAELRELHEAMLRSEPVAARGNLPAPLTGLLGREQAVAAVGELLRGARLVTLTGIGGVGKTRLALAVAHAARAGFADGAWLVELAGLSRPQRAEGIAEVVAAALDLRADPAPPAGAERVTAALREKELLLVLDNCEHVVEPVAAWTAGLLAGAPRVRVLATGQEALGLTGETSWPVPPLDLPAATRLFAARAAERQPGFVLDEQTSAVVTEICRSLDGIPLALELAANRVRLLGLAELRARLDDRFRLLVQGERHAPQRQRTLRAMVDWSWELLSPAEQVVLRRLAVHAEGCTLAAAEAVCAGGPVAEAEVLGLLGRLVDRSLVEVSDVDGRRYRLLESIGAYCLDRLREAGELSEIRAAHREHYLALAERAAPELRGPAQRDWLRRLDRESANLRRALDGALAEGHGVAALQVVRALLWYWCLRARLSEARRYLAAALSLVDSPSESELAWLAGFRLLNGERLEPGPLPADPHDAWFLGFCRYTTGDFAASAALLTPALAAFEQRDEPWGHAVTAATRAAALVLLGELDQAARDAATAARLAERTGDRWAQLLAALPQAELAEITGDHAAARHSHAEGLARAAELGLWIEACERLGGLGRIAMLTGEHDLARRHLGRARQLALDHGFESGRIHAEIGLALNARRSGDRAEAQRLLPALLDWHAAAGLRHGTALVLAELGFLAELRGEAATALAHHRAGLAEARAAGDPRAVALALEGLAGAQALDGDPAAAARLLGRAEAARAAVGAPLPPAERGDLDRITAALLAALGPEAFAAELARGRAEAA